MTTVFYKKITISHCFSLISNPWYNPRWRPGWQPLLVTSQASNSAITHKIYLILYTRSEGFPLKVKSFRNTATYQKRVPRWRYEFACMFEVQRYLDVSEKHQLDHVTSLDSKKLRVFSLPRNWQFGLRSIAGLNSSNKYMEFNRR